MSYRNGVKIIAAFTVAVLAGFLTLDRIAPAGRRLIKVRGEDPVSYFGTAHSVLFDHDFNLNNEYERMPPDARTWTANQPNSGLPGNVWGLGYPFLEIPLLALGTGVDALAGNPADGYSRWAVFFYCIGSPLIAGCGMVALFTFLCTMAEHWGIMPEDHQSAYALFITLVIFFGTNVGYYAFSQMAHSSTFLFASLFLAIWWRFRESEGAQHWLLLGLIGGFLSICRWQDVLYLGGPLLFDLFGGEVRKKGLAFWRSRLLYAVGVGIWWIPQIVEWKIVYWKYVTIPQGGGIFSFPPAHILQVLLSTQVGWFIWTPVTVFGVIGLLLGAFKETRIYLPWIIVLTLQIAVVGSISFWHGVESFGARYLLSNTPLIGLGLITIVGASTVWIRRSLAVACAACCAFTVLFAVQFRLNLVPEQTPLTFSELITDKLRLSQVRQRKAAARQASELLSNGDPDSAIRILEGVLSFGEDRDVDAVLAKAYRAAGKTDQADAAELKSNSFLESKLY
ncbi:MAG: tetratricopeptide repeat protein [Acidobacteriia bacterium]|nr:tetratricopeptide repeat protein [Terriglobia bacterium]